MADADGHMSSRGAGEGALFPDERMHAPMPNFKDDGKFLSFWANWKLTTRPRRVALLIDDAQEEYRPFAKQILPSLERLLAAFRDSDLPVVWSTWSRRFNDGICNAMDRWYGPYGVTSKENACYIYGTEGTEVLTEIKPSAAELEKPNRFIYDSVMLDMFWRFDEKGRSLLDEKLRSLDVDTIILTGLWTDECIVATAYAGLSRGYDVVVVSDAVDTATPNHAAALQVMRGTCSLVVTTEEVEEYVRTQLETCPPGSFKGKAAPDGRLELS
uniref:Isochorismatase-like domain-containing protein n=1 Tax=Chromera velia CCMP2878 TaxID=1169474 RepID=A0A0G4FGE7_9ALVE|eukprot:Cvel_16846.t1-p1 / transcript=Cvel_16846.t1 / gene=Cvel_16846 / organism=Chromera_velia_CCMP2878 / gene_product=hypothetical protein / transcript_product=hypothetical protein / location=Cvel_scaffold1317:29725-30534(+) / protein_length=270 / sequence_SO=supercontig / SO=protein_coding / is_pseudo=false